MKTGVLYIVWPGAGIEELLERSRASVAAVHPELPVHVERLPAGSTLLDKSRMHALTPFGNTLYLDADTVVLQRLDFGFEQSGRYGLALTHCECPWARRFSELANCGDAIEYNTGVMFFSHITRRLFGHWEMMAKRIVGRLPFNRGGELAVMKINDQASFAETMRLEGWNPFTLPMNWNFRPRWHRGFFGPIKIWHDYTPVSQGVVDWNEQQTAPDAVIDFVLVSVEQQLAEAAA
jgi:hypothetical protein